MIVEQILCVPLELHESTYRGGSYFRSQIGSTAIVLQANFMEDDGEAAEAEFPGEHVLLYLDGDLKLVDEIADVLARNSSSFKALRTSTY